jgi:beta-hydroxylase
MDSLTAKPFGMGVVIGKRLRLERCRKEHAAFLHNCYQNDSFWLPYQDVETIEKLTDRLEHESKSLPQHLNRIEWVIIRPGDQTEQSIPIGLASLLNFQPKHNLAEFVLGILRPEDRQVGIGMEAALLVLDCAFNFAYFHKLISFVYGDNTLSQKLTIGLGFRPEGYFHKHLWDQKRFIDVYQNGLLEEEFRANRRLARLSQRWLGRDITKPQVNIQLLPKSEFKPIQQKWRDLLSPNSSPQTAKSLPQVIFSPNDFPFAKLLENNWLVIKNEFLRLSQQDLISWPETSLYDQETASWKVFPLYKFGEKEVQNCQRFPETTRLIEQVPGLRTAAFSCTSPGLHIKPHVGYSQDFLRYHLAILVSEPDKCGIRIGVRVEKWHEGKSLIFDDSCEHEAWNNSSKDKVLLMIDFDRPPEYPFIATRFHHKCLVTPPNI